MSAVRTDPATIREVLAHADETSVYRAAQEYGLHSSTIARWGKRRERMGHQWPTDADVETWRTDRTMHADRRQHDAEWSSAYRKRVYLNRGVLQPSALGTTRRLQALWALGWTQGELGARMGVSAARVGHLMTGKFPTVFPSTAAAVRVLYDELSMTVPLDPGPRVRGQIRMHERVRRLASCRGYFPPLAYDDIDDPDEKPTLGLKGQPGRRKDEVDVMVVERVLAGEDLKTTQAEKRLIRARWLARGDSERSLCGRMGWKHGRYAEPILEGATG